MNNITKQAAFLCAAVLSTSALTLIGCGHGSVAASPVTAADKTVAIKGYLYGGPNPILGATVALYTTGFNTDGGGTAYPTTASADAYGVATLRSTTTSSATDGSFNLAQGYYCPAHQFAYLTTAAGNTGASATIGSGASAVSSLGVVSYTVTTPGAGFTSSPSVTSPTPSGGTQAIGTPVLTPTAGTASVSPGGSGYTSAPTVILTGTTGTATAVLSSSSLANLQLSTGGSGYAAGTTVTPTFTGGSGSGALATATLSSTANSISSMTLVAQGTGYGFGAVLTCPATFTGGTGVTTAAVGVTHIAATGKVTSYTVSNGGIYTTPPTGVSPTLGASPNCGSGTGSTGSIVNGYPVASILLTNGGSGYTSVPTVAFTATTTGNVAPTATVGLAATSVASVTIPATTKFTATPGISFSGGGGSGAAATITLTATTLASITPSVLGTGYTGTVTPTISGGGGDGTAAATTTLGVSQITGPGGSGYTNQPIVAVAAPSSGTTAAATATVSGGSVTGYTITTNGTGYTAAPAVTVSDAGGSLSSIAVTAGGASYTAPPTITFSGGGGANATATATISGGVVTAITLTNGGNGFTTTPTVVFTNNSSDTTGGGATATASFSVGNNGAVLVAALGRCEDLYVTSAGSSTYTGSYIYMNELTTVAAAYALGSFAKETRTDGARAISIGAPDSNNSFYVTGSNNASTGCITTANSGCSTANGATPTYTSYSAGLYHAFLNATDLVNVFQPPTSGLSSANVYLPNGTNAAAILPTALINTIANAMVSCVNSTGSASPSCNVFLAAGGPAGSPAPDAFTAASYIALHPTLSGTGVSVSQIANLGTSVTNVYSPYITSVSSTNPHDLSLAVVYPQGTGAVTSPASQGLNYIASLALDPNDALYVGNETAAAPNSTTGNILSFSSNGAVLSTTANVASSTDAALANAAVVAPDGSGTALYQLGGGQSTNQIVKWTVVNGAVTSGSDAEINCSGCGLAYSLAADKYSNMWFGQANGKLYEFPAGTATTTAPTLIGVAGGTLAMTNLEVDPYNNIWTGTINGTFNSVFENTGGIDNGTTSSTLPAYSGTLATQGTAGATTTTLFGSSNAGSYIAVNVRYSGTSIALDGPQKNTYVLSGYAVTSETLGTAASTAGVDNYSLAAGAIDGNNTVFDTTSLAGGYGLVQVFQSASNAYALNTGVLLQPCYALRTSNITCTNPFSATPPTTVVIDSAGSIWSSNTNGGTLIQVLGGAVPAAPLLGSKLTTKP